MQECVEQLHAFGEKLISARWRGAGEEEGGGLSHGIVFVLFFCFVNAFGSYSWHGGRFVCAPCAFFLFFGFFLPPPFFFFLFCFFVLFTLHL